MKGASLRELDLVPERVERRDPRICDHDAALACECFDGLEAACELVGGAVERERGVHARAAAEIDDGEQQVLPPEPGAGGELLVDPPGCLEGEVGGLLGDAAGLQKLVEALRNAGYGGDDLAKICRENWLRILASAWHETAAA